MHRLKKYLRAHTPTVKSFSVGGSVDDSLGRGGNFVHLSWGQMMGLFR